jgi:hypothetical protein
MNEQQTRAQQLMGDIAPKLVELTDDVLFGDVWKRPGLTPRAQHPNAPERTRTHPNAPERTRTHLVDTYLAALVYRWHFSRSLMLPQFHRDHYS